jgi:alpha-galactosidase
MGRGGGGGGVAPPRPIAYESRMTSEWTLDNTSLTCTLALADGALSWRLDGPAGLATSPTALSPLTVDGQTPRWERVLDARTHDEPGGEKTLTVELEDPGGLRLAQHVQLFPGRPFARIWAELTNAGHEPRRVTECAILSLEVGTAPTILFHVDQFSWVYRRDFFTPHEAQVWPGRLPIEVRMGSFPSHHNGPSSCAWFALRPGAVGDPPDGPPISAPGLVAGIEFNGKSRLRAWAEPDATRITSTIDDLAHALAPGAVFEVPACFVGQYTGDWDEAGYVTQRFAEAHVHPPRPDDRYPWLQYNSWKYGQEIDEAQQLAVIDRCAELGVELAVLDLGWARTIGDWRPNPEKFPRGLAPIAERARSYGMRFGVHMALAQCAPDAPIAHEHPEWLAGTYDDYFGAGRLCLGHQPCRDWLIGEILRLIDEDGIDYIIQDGEDMVKRCERADHTHAPGDSNYAGSQQGIDVVIEAIRRERPHVVLENCEDGGCMMTYKMARLYHTSITVDNIATYATRQGIYGASYPFSPRYSVRYMEDDPTPYTLRSSIFGGPLIFMQRIGDWDAQQMADTRAAAEQYKQLRLLVRDAKIIHLRPPRYNIDRLGWGWDAIQAVAPDQSRSVVMVYRAQGDAPEYTVRPRGLAPDTTYTVRLGERGEHARLSGAALERDGVVMALGEFAAEMIWLDREEG